MSAAHLYRESTGAGPDVALLHGWGLHGGLFGAFARDLAAAQRVHALDLPGHGRSPWAKGCADLEGIARRVAEHLPERTALLGWSLGGLIAMRIATLFPARIARLVLVATTPRFLRGRDWPCGQAEEVLATMGRDLARDWSGTVRDFLSLQVRGDEHALETLRELRQAAFAHGPPSTGALAAGLEILRHADLREEARRIAAPTLVLGGSLDRLAPPAALEALAARIPGATLERVAGAAHAPFLSHRATVAPRIAAFLAGGG